LFSLDEYGLLLQNFLELGYKYAKYDDIDSGKRHIVLRHDVDMSVNDAHKVALIEHSLNIKAYYFILVRSELYNIFDPLVSRKILDILNMGHMIELHFDTSLYSSTDDLDFYAEHECKILEKLTNSKVSIISFHRPEKKILNNSDLIAGRMHTYQPKFFSDIGYCSDSKGDWLYGHPLQHDAIVGKTALQLLTHPIWWARSGSVQQKLDELSIDNFNKFKQSLSDNCVPYQFKQD
jgi:hypothetical protein